MSDFPWQRHAERAQDEADALRAILTDLIAELQSNKRVAVEGILLDLISDLRDMACDGIDSGWAPLLSVADGYEDRLREVTRHE